MLPNRRGRGREGFQIGRLIMVVSSISPLFLLWGVKGISLVPDIYLIPCCTLIIVLPAAFVLGRIKVAKKRRDTRRLIVGTVANYDYHALTYIFAMLLPFYRQDIDTVRELAAIVVAIVFIIIIFWYLNLHYMNVIFVLGRYKTYLVHPPIDGNPYGGTTPYVLISRRPNIVSGDVVIGYRVTNTVYLEEHK